MSSPTLKEWDLFQRSEDKLKALQSKLDQILEVKRAGSLFKKSCGSSLAKQPILNNEPQCLIRNDV